MSASQKNPKTDNSNLATKIHLRLWLMDKHCNGTPIVLDACAGSQIIWKSIRKTRHIQYTSIDKMKRETDIKGDAEKLLKAGGARFDVLDIDTYGKPWKIYYQGLKCIKKKAIIFLTIGSVNYIGGGMVDKFTLDRLGLTQLRRRIPETIITWIAKKSLARMLEMCYDFDMEIEECIEGFPNNGKTRYIGLAIKRKERR